MCKLYVHCAPFCASIRGRRQNNRQQEQQKIWCIFYITRHLLQTRLKNFCSSFSNSFVYSSSSFCSSFTLVFASIYSIYLSSSLTTKHSVSIHCSATCFLCHGICIELISFPFLVFQFSHSLSLALYLSVTSFPSLTLTSAHFLCVTFPPTLKWLINTLHSSD